MRVVITEKEYLELKKIQGVEVIDALVAKIELEREKQISKKKIKATKKATKVREDKAKSKIINAINLLRLYGDKITVYSVAKEAGVSFNTAKKYREIIDG